MLAEILSEWSSVVGFVSGLGSVSGMADEIAFVIAGVLVVWAASLWITGYKR